MPKNSEILTIGEIIERTKQYLAKCKVDSPRLDAEILLCHVLGKERIYLYVNFDQPLSVEEVDLYRELVRRRGKGEPVAYILGRRSFLQLELLVNSSVLIPRPETELLAEVGIRFCRAKAGVRLLDIGTGSGALTLGILHNSPGAKALAVDISTAALAVARENADRLGLAQRVDFVQSDVYEAVGEKDFDLIVSNPPYIVSADLAGLGREVKQEPRLALDGGLDGLDCYRRIVGRAKDFLRADGLLAMEIGCEQGQDLSALVQQAGFSYCKVLKDYAGLDRIVLAAGEGLENADKVLAPV